MKIVRLTWRPSRYVEKIFSNVDNISEYSYEEIMRIILSDFWGTSDAWENGFATCGYESELFIVNIPTIEKAWRHKTGRTRTGKSFVQDIIAYLQPDVLLIEGLEFFQPGQLLQMRDALQVHAVLAGVSGFEIYDNQLLSQLDLFLTCRPDFAESLRASGLNAVHLPHAFDSRILQAISFDEHKTESRIPFGFIGSILPGSRLHDDRRRVLQAIASRFDFPFYSPSNVSWAESASRWFIRSTAYHAAKPMKPWLASVSKNNRIISALSKASQWHEAPSFEYIPGLTSKMKPPVFGLDMYRALSRMQTTLNMQPGLSNNHATNMRLFEATGVATCLVTDRAVDIGDYFTDDEVVTYKSADEAVERVGWLCENPSKAAEIGRRGQQRTLRSHTYEQRLEIMVPALRSALSSRPKSRPLPDNLRQAQESDKTP